MIRETESNIDNKIVATRLPFGSVTCLIVEMFCRSDYLSLEPAEQSSWDLLYQLTHRLSLSPVNALEAC